MNGLTAMDGNGWLIDDDGRWMAMDGDVRRNSHSTAMDLTAMDGEGLLDSDSTGMDEEERRERDGNGPRAQQ